MSIFLFANRYHLLIVTVEMANDKSKKQTHFAFSPHLLEPKKSPFFDIKPVSIDVIAGESADFECHVTGAQPMRITWSKDNKEIRPGGNYTITYVGNTPHLRILKVGKGDSGQYTCQATNDVGKDMCSAQLSVKGIIMWHLPMFVLSPVCVKVSLVFKFWG